MSLTDNRKLYHVSEIDPDVGLWSVIVQVVESHRTQVTKSKNGSPKRTFKRYLLVDENGTKVSGVVYEPDIEFISNILKQFQRYRISNAKLTPAYGFFKVGQYGFSWVMKPETPIEPLADPIPPPIPFNYTFCPFKDFVTHADKDSGFNVKGIVVHTFPRRIINQDSSNREIVLVDESLTPIIVTLWNSFGTDEGSIIASNIDNHPVIYGVNMKATTFHGLSLGTRMYSCILVEPPTPDKSILHDWYTANKEAIAELVKARAYKNMDLLLPPPDLTETINVPTAIQNLPIINSAWVNGMIRFSPSPQQYFVCACANCYRKADTGSDWILLCSNCGAYEEVKLRCRVPIQLEGDGRSMQVVLTSPDVEILTGLTAAQMRDAHQYGDANPTDFNVNDDLLLGLDKLNVICFVKKYDSKSLGNNRTPGIRFSVVKTYALDTLRKDEPQKKAASSSFPKHGSPTQKNQSPPSKTKESDKDVNPPNIIPILPDEGKIGSIATVKIEKGQAQEAASLKIGVDSAETRPAKRGKK